MPAYQVDQFLPDIDPSCWIAPCASPVVGVEETKREHALDACS
jgi:hypothetical protein